MQPNCTVLTITRLYLSRPPHHGVRLPVPDAADGLLRLVLLPGEMVAWAGVDNLISQLPVVVWPGDVHAHEVQRSPQTTTPL